jgi:hypothetical protein
MTICRMNSTKLPSPRQRRRVGQTVLSTTTDYKAPSRYNRSRPRRSILWRRTARPALRKPSRQKFTGGLGDTRCRDAAGSWGRRPKAGSLPVYSGVSAADLERHPRTEPEIQPFFGNAENRPISDASLGAGKSDVFRHLVRRAEYSCLIADWRLTRRQMEK